MRLSTVVKVEVRLSTVVKIGEAIYCSQGRGEAIYCSQGRGMETGLLTLYIRVLSLIHFLRIIVAVF